MCLSEIFNMGVYFLFFAISCTCTQYKKIVYYTPRGRKGTLLTSTENTRVDEVPLPRGAYTIFYNTCVISDVFWNFQI